MSSYQTLYQEVILEHNKKPRNYAVLSASTHSAEGINPLCGDHLNLSLNLKEDVIVGIGFQGESCAICKASASMMTVAVKSKSADYAKSLTQQFLALLTGKSSIEGSSILGNLLIFSGIVNLPTRVKCAILPWHTLLAALNSVKQTSTEGKHDPVLCSSIPGQGNDS